MHQYNPTLAWGYFLWKETNRLFMPWIAMEERITSFRYGNAQEILLIGVVTVLKSNNYIIEFFTFK